MPVCIAGMHRSGTSLVARILGECGLFLGPSDDLLAANEENREGFWENRRFVELNDELLAAFGGSWDAPPAFPADWERAKTLGSLRRRARELVKEFEAREPWGWKDPRSSLTIRFWQQIVPGLKVVHCVRDPLEVADSLERRGNTSARSHLDLWLAYNRELVSSVPVNDRIVTHYDAFFTNGEAEVKRLTVFVGLEPEELQVAHAATAVNEAVRHHQATGASSANGLPTPVARCYAQLCSAAKLAAAKTDSPASFPYTTYDDSPGSTHNLVVGLVPKGARVLEVGCATGYMSAVLKERLGAVVTGIEISPAAATAARRHCDRVVVGDVETLDLDELFPQERFDAILFADVLEHLKDPQGVLRRVRGLLTEHGLVVASMPNVAHGSVRLALLRGEFRYAPTGLLDETHLRFFTRESLQDLFEAAGYIVTALLRRRIPISESEVPAPEAPIAVQEAVGRDPEATTYQFVASAAPTEAANQLHALRTRLRASRDELEELRPVAEKLDRRTAELMQTQMELEQLGNAQEALKRRLVRERAAFADHVHELESLQDDEEEVARLQHELQHLHEELARHAAVVEDQRRHLEILLSSRSLRYTGPLRKAAGFLRRRRDR